MVRRSEILGSHVLIAGETAGASPVDGECLPGGDGLTVEIGPLSSGDVGAIASWFAGLGAETRYSRFFSPLKRLDRRLQSALACVDHVDHEAIVARGWDGATVGIARYIRLGQSRTAEVAVAVADAWRGRGIATTLLERVATRARAVGIERLVATCLSRNEPVIRLLSRLGETTVGPSDVGLVDVRIDLTRPSLLAPGGAPGDDGCPKRSRSETAFSSDARLSEDPPGPALNKILSGGRHRT